mmetsp:Transcript_20947/g.32237  ORF Transcript_20947/g.32237 Transcript_20947/m.32237 type:complete len:227 (+) Transcript_20947:163-843(+)|eukprot:CAMPEP_0195301464 /NCGR_PEP_ID=MMETSP0707-20130614/29348_1 /TAXON_ID=33640 /ORGANISM="Asterionellopsis glacialis, Strain CCMP134" /LENGTH=226 /DNA_ID=CAMNT_0040364413 /DNA_START=135 /DNA_END=815 /DNA_ORIENTATION=+
MHNKSILISWGSGLRGLFIFFLVGQFTAFLNVSAYIGPLQRRNIPKIEDELGLSPTLSFLSGRSDVFFDPLNFATDENFAKLREAELKHGRVAMMATLGMVLPNVLIDAANQNFEFVSIQQIPSGVAAIKSLWSTEGTQILLTCGFIEIFVLRQRDPKDMPGDYGVGYFGMRDKALHERSLICELENGRLAMVAFVGQVVLEIVTGDPCLTLLQTRIASYLNFQIG